MSKSKFAQQTIFFMFALLLMYCMLTMPIMSFLGWYVVASAMIGVIISAYYHRFLSHKSWNCPKWVEYTLGIMAAGHALTPAISWVAVHRKHHRFSDTERDIHGPRKGALNNLLISYYDAELSYAGRSLLTSKFYQFQLKYYFHIFVVYSILWILLFGWQSWAIIGGWGYIGQVSLNWFGHNKTEPVNRPELSVVLAGETYHKNHHEDPSNPRFGSFDLPYLCFIKLFAK